MSDFLISQPEPEFDLYNDGFEGKCRLGRAKEGKKLSELVERVSQPLVIAVDAPWGAGKSFFLKCWVGAHTEENHGSATTVYIDAFKHDYMDDPLIGLTSVISERFEKEGKQPKRWKTAKEAAAKLVRPAIRVGLAAATAGATEVASVVVDAGLEAGSKELEKAATEFWKKEDGRRAAMQGFREALQEIASEKRLVIVVDELDRCRPDYALNLLEVIKHFFDVPNVHFVLGANLKELANSVRARYGAAVQGERYLQKFISVRMPLMPRKALSPSRREQIRHFSACSQVVDLEGSWKYQWISEYLEYVDYHAGLSLRDVEKIATLALVTPDPKEKPNARLHLYVGVLILSVMAPRVIEEARSGTLKSQDVFAVFELEQRPPDMRSPHFEAHAAWTLATMPRTAQVPSYLHGIQQRDFEENDPQRLLREVIAESLDVFQQP